jgi:predicted NBD/HSP70 family sugar kinase
LLKERLNLPIYVENNATAAAIGERWHGAGKRVENFFFIHFDAGLGGGLILNGRPYYGFSGNAGELGFLPTFAEGRVLNKIGSYVSLAALYRTLRNQGETRTEPASLEILYTEGHSGLLEWLDATSRYLAPVLIIVENLFDPEAFFFGGRLPKPLTEHIIKGLNVLMSPLRIQGKRYTPALQAAEAGEDAAALGSATLPIYEHFVPDAKLPLRIGRGPTLPA